MRDWTAASVKRSPTVSFREEATIGIVAKPLDIGSGCLEEVNIPLR